nr:hypothetical protein [Pelagicoccus enzymogenes]
MGNRASGTKAVTGIGTDSQIHQMAIKAAAPAVRQPSTESPLGGSTSKVNKRAPGPNSQPDHCLAP